MPDPKQKNNGDPTNKCLFVCHTFPPIAAVGIYRTLRFMKHMPSFGWEGIVLAMKAEAAIDHPIDQSLCDRIPRGAVVERVGVWRPLDRLIEWIKHCFRKKDSETSGKTVETSGAENASVDVSPPNSKSFFVRLRKFLVATRDVLFYTPDNCANWIGPAVIAGSRLVRRHRPQVIFSSGPPHSAHLAALGIHWLTRVPLVIDLRDPWASDEWLNQEDYRLRLWLQKKLERLCVRFADQVILNTERLRQNFVATYPPRWEHKFIAIPNGVDDQIIKPVQGYLNSATKRPAESPLVICHPGSIYWHRSLIPLIEAVRLLKNSGHQVQFEQIGLVTHPPDLAEQLLEWELPEVELCGRLSHETTLQRMANADVLVVIQPMSTLQVPAKLYEMLVFRKPILVITKDGATADLIRKYGIGVIADPSSPEDIANTIQTLDGRMNENGIKGNWDRAITDFDSRNLTENLLDVFAGITIEKRAKR